MLAGLLLSGCAGDKDNQEEETAATHSTIEDKDTLPYIWASPDLQPSAKPPRKQSSANTQDVLDNVTPEDRKEAEVAFYEVARLANEYEEFKLARARFEGDIAALRRKKQAALDAGNMSLAEKTQADIDSGELFVVNETAKQATDTAMAAARYALAVARSGDSQHIMQAAQEAQRAGSQALASADNGYLSAFRARNHAAQYPNEKDFFMMLAKGLEDNSRAARRAGTYAISAASIQDTQTGY